MDTNAEPKLDPPGAGLPAAELFVARILFRKRLRKGSRESFNEAFGLDRATIRRMVDEVDAGAASKRVLIDRVRGLEDSSRFWSIWMTLEHLRIVHVAIANTIAELAAGRIPPGEVSTAAIKPSPDATRAVVGEYERSCDNLLRTIANVSDLKTKEVYAHPWFGPLDAFGWHALAAGHLRIHREQIERISAKLRAPA